MYACLAVTCHLHFWQNDRDLLRATVVTRGWNGYRNKSQHRKSTLEKKILPPFRQGFSILKNLGLFILNDAAKEMERAKRSWKEDWTYEVERFCYVTTAGPVAAAVWSVDVRPVLKWANICFVNLVGLFVEPSPTQLILNWTQFCFANLVRSIRRTATKLYSGSKKLRSGNTRPVWRTLPLIGWD